MDRPLIHHFLEKSADRFPDKTAVVHEKERISYAETNSCANSLAVYLIDLGIKEKDRVVIILENSIQYVISYYGILKSGAVAVPLNFGLKPNNLKPLLAELEPVAIISSSRFERVLKASEVGQFGVRHVILKDPRPGWQPRDIRISDWERVIALGPYENPDLPIKEDTLASIIYTSGSTGEPKGVMLSHKNIVSNTKSICTYLNISEKDKQMVVLPFYYVMGKSLLNTHFASGGTVVINNKFAFPATVLKQMEEEEITAFSGVPSTYAYLLHRSPIERYKDRLSHLRYCSQAGGHMSNHIKRGLLRALPDHTEIYIMYGATEASARLAYLEPRRYEDKMGSIGKAIPGVTLQVTDKDGQELPPGHTGELIAFGDNIMLGYWKTETDVIDQRGWYHTGDLAYTDEEGFLYLVGRKDGLIKVGGHRINPVEIEEAILDTGLAVEAAVFGVDDELLGKKLVALVTPTNREISETEVLNECSKRLPKHKIPSYVKLIKALPKNNTGKVDRSGCMKLLNTINNRSMP